MNEEYSPIYSAEDFQPVDRETHERQEAVADAVRAVYRMVNWSGDSLSGGSEEGESLTLNLLRSLRKALADANALAGLPWEC